MLAASQRRGHRTSSSSLPAGIAADVEDAVPRRRRRPTTSPGVDEGPPASSPSRRGRSGSAAARCARWRRRSARRRSAAGRRPPRAAAPAPPAVSWVFIVSRMASSGPERDLRRIADAGEARAGARRPASAACRPSARIASSCAPRAMPDDLLPRQRQRRRDRAADRADAVDDDPHRTLPDPTRHRHGPHAREDHPATPRHRSRRAGAPGSDAPPPAPDARNPGPDRAASRSVASPPATAGCPPR